MWNLQSNGIALCDKSKALHLILGQFIKDELEQLWHHPFCFEQIEGTSWFLDLLPYPLALIEPCGNISREIQKWLVSSQCRIKINMHASQDKAPQSTSLPSANDASVTGTASPTSLLSMAPTPTLSVSSGTSLTSSPTTTNQVSEGDSSKNQ